MCAARSLTSRRQLHTFYFLLTFGTMAAWRSINYTWWGPRLKLAVVALGIYVVWEGEQLAPRLFDLVFAPLAPLLAEANGSLHEWHFRTFLDHYSTLFGMLFALNFPYLVGWFAVVERRSWRAQLAFKSLVALPLVGAGLWWYSNVFSLDKYAFNAAHPYWMWIPILLWIYVRNLTPTLRSYHSSLVRSRFFVMFLSCICCDTLKDCVLSSIRLAKSRSRFCTRSCGGPLCLTQDCAFDKKLTHIDLFAAISHLYALEQRRDVAADVAHRAAAGLAALQHASVRRPRRRCRGATTH